MDEDFASIHHSPIQDHKYAQWFQEVRYNGKTLSEEDRKKLVDMIDESIVLTSPLRHPKSPVLCDNTLIINMYSFQQPKSDEVRK